MLTVIIAWINAKYDAGYEGLFVAAFFVDLFILSLLENIIIK